MQPLSLPSVASSPPVVINLIATKHSPSGHPLTTIQTQFCISGSTHHSEKSSPLSAMAPLIVALNSTVACLGTLRSFPARARVNLTGLRVKLSHHSFGSGRDFSLVFQFCQLPPFCCNLLSSNPPVAELLVIVSFPFAACHMGHFPSDIFVCPWSWIFFS